MSREEIGAAAATRTPPRGVPLGPRAAVPAPPPSSLDPEPGPAPPRPRCGPRSALVAVAAVLALGAPAGWGGVRAWDSAPAGPSAESSPIAWARVVDDRPSTAVAARTGVDLVVRVTSLSSLPLEVEGAVSGFDAATVSGVEPVGVTVPPGGSATVVVHAAVACASPRPLHVPALQVRRADRLRDAVELAGAGDVLAALCGHGTTDRRVVVVQRVRTDGDRLQVFLVAPTGRTTRLEGVGAGGLALGGTPLPAVLDGVGRAVWLDRPTRCPAAWATGGVPRVLDLDLDVGAPARVSVDAGPELPRWLLAGPCTPGAVTSP